MIACKKLCSTWWCIQNQQCYEARRAGIDKVRVRELYARTQHLSDAYPKQYKKRKTRLRVGTQKKSSLYIFTRDNYTCQYCGFKGEYYELSRDHVIPKASGGTNALDNLTTACKPCNSLKGSMHVDEFKRMLINLKQ